MGSRSKYHLSRFATQRGLVPPADLADALNVLTDRPIEGPQQVSRKSGRLVTTRWYGFTVRRDRRRAKALVRRHVRWLRTNTVPEDRTSFERQFIADHACGV